MTVNGNGHAKARLEISGIPLQCDVDRMRRALQDYGKPVFSEKIDLNFTMSAQPERRVTANLSGLQPELVPWITEVIKKAISDCAHPKYEISAVLARN